MKVASKHLSLLEKNFKIQTSFESLKLITPILKALNHEGYKVPTPIQQAAIPLIKTGRDLLAQAPTGTGKTAAFVLPTLEKIAISHQRKWPQILVLTPTRELAIQITNHVYKYGKYLRIQAVSIIGGAGYREQIKRLSRPCDIVVATPGRLMDYLKRENILNFSHIHTLILDEADRMLDMGFIDDVRSIAKALPLQKRQTLFFTATLDKTIEKLAQTLLKSPERIGIDAQETTAAPRITQRVYFADTLSHKWALLKHFLKTEPVFKAIIFSGTQQHTEKLTYDLKKEGYDAEALHGGMRQNKRTQTVRRFKNGDFALLIATDVAARGLHVDDITYVFNYDGPRSAEDYIHRIGRTGRAGKTGIAISFFTPAEKKLLNSIEHLTGQTLLPQTVAGLEPKKSHESFKSRSKKIFKNPVKKFHQKTVYKKHPRANITSFVSKEGRRQRRRED